MSTVRLTLISKPECHLCEEAEVVVRRVISRVAGMAERDDEFDGAPDRNTQEGRGVPAKRASQRKRQVTVELEELNILEDPALAAKHSEYIPVVLINGKRHAIWKVDEGRLTAAIEKAGKKRFLF